MIYIPIFVNAALLLLFDYRCLSFSLFLPLFFHPLFLSFSHSFFSNPLSLRLISVTPHTPLLFPRLPLFFISSFFLLSLFLPHLLSLFVLSQFPLLTPHFSSIVSSGLAAFSVQNVTGPERILRTSIISRPNCT